MKKSKKIASATLAACLALQGTSVQALTTEVTPQLETEEIVPEVVAPTEGTVEQAEEVTPQSEPEEIVPEVAAPTEGTVEQAEEALKQTVESEGTMFAHLASGEKLTIDAKNQVRKENQLAVYTGAFGPTTNNNEWGHEIVVDNEMKVTAIYQKGAIAPGGKGATIPQGGFVLSAHGTAVNERILQVALGETITLEGVGELTPPVVAGVYVEQGYF